ncbi:MAG: hypothetical protein KF760_00695 [Candidatus Eremiobacteraeota bacterium]|nr:hypothetical protein [Candidatus Eremiobacteraeota bacterium]MCW5871608.1 hypothetical protein [Candidatus Eremiobacteraeota bacterium]
MKIKRVALAMAAGLALAWAQPGVDQRALSTPPAKEKTLDLLARTLCPSHYSEEEKARSIFRWVADRIVYDVEGLRLDKLPSQQPEDVLRSRRAVCEGYARLYQALGERAGLQVAFISGRSSFNDALPFKLPNNVAGHGWNAVLLKGRWRLLDVTWAAGAVDAQARFQKGFDDFWYLTTPEQFVFTHFPKDPKWQMLAEPWDSRRFESSPQYTGEFFRIGIKPPPDLRQPVSVRPDTVFSFRAPEDVVAISDLRDSRGQTLENRAFCQSPRGTLEVRVRCPQAGNYRLVLFGRRREAAWQGNLKAPQKYKGLVELSVRAQAGVARPFPKTFGSFQRGGAELLTPFDGRLRARSRQRFRLRVPGAQEVAFFAGKDYLGKLEPKGSLYEGTVTCPARGVPLQVCAKYPQEARYWGLVEYEIE